MPKRKDLNFLETINGVSKQELDSMRFAKGAVVAERYEVVQRIGAGGMGIVYKVKDRVLRNDLKALKVMLPRLVIDPKAQERFCNEILLAQKMNHHNILRVYDYGKDGDLSFFTMEYVDGLNMREWLEQEHHQGHISLPVVAPLIVEILMGLSSAHQLTVHRDIKPENILLPKPPSQIKIKICDFGLAQLQDPGQSVRSSHIMGTFNYMAPEQQIYGSHIDKRADLYAVGVIFYEALTQEKPAGLFELPCTLRPELPPQVDHFVKRALKQKPDDRFQDADEMMQALQQLTPEISPATETRTKETSATSLKVLSLEQEFAANLQRLKDSGIIRAYVWQHQGTWSEEDWEQWTHELQLQGYYPLDEDALNKELEQEQATLEETRREVATKKRMIVSLEKGFRYQDGLNLIAELAEIGLKDEELDELSACLEQKQRELSENRDAGMKLWHKRDISAIHHLERALALNPLDKEVKSALAAACQEKADRERRYADLLQAGDNLVSKGQLTQAIATWESALGLVSDESEALAKIEEIQRKHQACLDLLQRATDEANPFQRQTLLQEVLAINSLDQDATTMLTDTEQEIASRRRQYDDAQKQGKSLQLEGKLAEAIAALHQGLGLIPDEQSLQQNIHELEEKQQQVEKFLQTAQAQTDPFLRQPLLKEAMAINPASKDLLAMLAEAEQEIANRRQQYEAALEQGALLQEQGKLHEAIETLRQGIGLIPDEQELQQNMESVETKQSQVAQLLDSAQSAADPLQALAHLEQAQKISSDDEQIQRQLEQVQQQIEERRLQYSELLEQGRLLAEQGDFDNALALWRQGIGLVADDSELQAKIGELEDRSRKCRELLDKARQHEDDEEYEAAEKHYSDYLQIQPNDPQVEALLQAIPERIAKRDNERYLAEAKRKESEGELETALAICEKALTLMATEQVLAQKQRLETGIRDKQYEEWMEKGRKKEIDNDFSAAEFCYNSALELNPANDKAQQALAALPDKKKALQLQIRREKARRKKILVLTGTCLLVGCIITWHYLSVQEHNRRKQLFTTAYDKAETAKSSRDWEKALHWYRQARNVGFADADRSIDAKISEVEKLQKQQVTISQLQIEAKTISLYPGETYNFQVKAYNKFNQNLPLPANLHWQATLGVIDDEGHYQAEKTGAGVVTVTAKNIKAQARITVHPQPEFIMQAKILNAKKQVCSEFRAGDKIIVRVAWKVKQAPDDVQVRVELSGKDIHMRSKEQTVRRGVSRLYFPLDLRKTSGKFKLQAKVKIGNRSSKENVAFTVKEKEKEKPVRTSSDGRFQVFADNVIKDTTTGLEWYVGPDKDTTHYEAEKWVANLSVAGGGWRMPTIAELRKIYESNKVTGKDKYGDSIYLDPVFKTTGYWVWSGELLDANGKPSQNRNSPRARHFLFDFGLDGWDLRDFSNSLRVFAVRRRRR